ncbi:Branched-chain amino acid aminotransferase [hydrothermal vent metagenome]|uniref:Branched-chain amino acid aminotransferase n=1 Tax=hydrothermal vent metagenome TaxID=652676 RepID=A0A3B0QRS3_9ZZZZ
MSAKVYINGRIVAGNKARVSVFDSGLCFGYGLFETMKVDGGSILFFDEHIRRLKSGARDLGIKTPTKKELALAINKLLKANNNFKGTIRLKIMITAGELAFGSKPTSKPTVIITTEEVDTEALQKRLEKGITAVTLRAPEFALREPSSAHIKNLNYLPSILGRAHATKQRAAEGIFIDTKGRVLEGTASNVFIVKGRRIITPPLYGILPGVTRAVVIGLDKKIKEATATERALFAADEAFVTGSTSGVVPLIKVDGKKVGSGKVGTITRSLQESYSGLVAKLTK